MKIVGIGDPLIPSPYIRKGFERIAEKGVRMETVQWDLKNYEELQHINLQVEQHGSEAYEPPEYILDEIRDADIIITQFCTITKKVMDYCKNLKAIGVLRGGFENVNLDYANEKGILVFNTPGRNSTAVADFTVGLLLAECRNIARSHYNLKNGNWVRDYANAGRVPDLEGKNAGIIGLGQIGRKVAKRLLAFDMNILSYDPFVTQAPENIKMVSLDELMRESDFITIHARLTKETEKLISREMIALMKPTACLINSARSGLVDEEALYQALKEKRITGAALDVFDQEPPGKDYPLVRIDNVTITPHLAGGTSDAFTNSPKLLCEEMLHLWDGKESRFLVNKDTYKKVGYPINLT